MSGVEQTRREVHRCLSYGTPQAISVVLEAPKKLPYFCHLMDKKRTKSGEKPKMTSETFVLTDIRYTVLSFLFGELVGVMKLWWLWVLMSSVSHPRTLLKQNQRTGTTGMRQPSLFKRSSFFLNLRTRLFCNLSLPSRSFQIPSFIISPPKKHPT